MEHKLITGGEQFLPFARSRIKAMRATGLNYSSQEFYIGGSRIQVRVAGAEDYISISGGGCTFSMDSGLVNLRSVRDIDPQSRQNGILCEVGEATEYNARFAIDPESTSLWRDWRVNKSSKDNQISGIVSTSGLSATGHVPVDGKPSAAFRPKLVPVQGEPGEPIEYEESSDDETLAQKKYLAATCPASVFTGRCRLYVQALYGLHLYKYSDITGTKGDAEEPLPRSYLIAGPLTATGPTLKVTAYQAPGDSGPPAEQVLILTSTGVYYDPNTAKHYLRNIEDNRDLVSYPLVSSRCGEEARKLLLAGPSATMTEQDLEHLEAYILSESLPDVKNKKVIGTGIVTVNLAWGMGYGWHWNWSGTAADIVIAQPYAQDDVHAGMESYHYRIDAGLDSAASRTVSGPSRWAIERAYWSFAEPNWGAEIIRKTTPKVTIAMAGNAPFYVFYIRDKLKLCSINVALIPDSPEVRAVSPPQFASPIYGGPIGGATLGGEGGFVKDSTVEQNYFAATISCGDYLVEELGTNRSKSIAVYEVLDKTIVSPPPFEPNGWGTGFGQLYIPYGSPPYAIQDIPVGRSGPETYGHWSWKYENYTEIQEKYSQAAVVVPLYDAEAIYIWSQKTQRKSSLGSRTNYSSFFPDSPGIGGIPWSVRAWYRPISYSYPIEYLDRIGYSSAGIGAPFLRTVSTEVISEPTAISAQETQSKLISHGGVTDVADFYGVPEPFASDIITAFFDNTLEEMPASFATFSGVSVRTPIVIARGRIETINGTDLVDTDLPQDFASPPVALVGWV